jgi:hypothetical protein
MQVRYRIPFDPSDASAVNRFILKYFFTFKSQFLEFMTIDAILMASPLHCGLTMKELLINVTAVEIFLGGSRRVRMNNNRVWTEL